MLRRGGHLVATRRPSSTSPAAPATLGALQRRNRATSTAMAQAAAATASTHSPPQPQPAHARDVDWAPFGPKVSRTTLPTPLPADVAERHRAALHLRSMDPRKVPRRRPDIHTPNMGFENFTLSSLTGASLGSLDADDTFFPPSRTVENVSILKACLNTGLISRAAKLFADLRAEANARLAYERSEPSGYAESSAMAERRNAREARGPLTVAIYNLMLQAFLRKAWQEESIEGVSQWVQRAWSLFEDMEAGKDPLGRSTADPRPDADTLATMAKGIVRLLQSNRYAGSSQPLLPIIHTARNLGIPLRSLFTSHIFMAAEADVSTLGQSREGEPDARLVLQRLSAVAVETANAMASRELSEASQMLNRQERQSDAEGADASQKEPETPELAPTLSPRAGEGAPEPVFNLTLLQQNLTVVHEAKRAFSDPYERQKWLEHSALEAARQRIAHGAEQLQELGLQNAGVMQTKTLQAWMWDWYNKLEPVLRKDIQRIQAAEEPRRFTASAGTGKTLGMDAQLAPFLSLVPANKMALITILELMRLQGTGGVADGMKTTRALVSVGRAVETEYHAEVLRKHPQIFQNARKAQLALRKKGVLDFQTRKALKSWLEAGGQKEVQAQVPQWPQITRARVGSYLVSRLMQVATVHREARDRDGVLWKEEQPAFYAAYQYLQGKKLGVIKLNEVVAKRLDKESVHETLNPRFLPMLVPPRPWLGHDSGGYYSVRSSAMRYKDSAEQSSYLRAASEGDGLEIVLAGLDVLGQTAWNVNQRVFDVVTQVWNSGDGIADMPPRTLSDPEPEKPDNYDIDIQARGVYLQRLKQHNLARAANHAQRCDVNYKLEIARAFLNERFYFPHNMDFRGRAYPIPPHLNHMGNDLCRGLLTFADAKPLGDHGLRWLRIHLANVYGYDKASFAEREQFAIDHEREVRAVAKDPLGEDGRWWLKADDPWQCLATCFELQAALDHPGGPAAFPTRLPVHQDGTCNGLQHYAALGGDLAGAKQVNLSRGERPSDVYTGVADLVIQIIDRDAERGSDSIKQLARKLQGKVTRKVVKQTVMTTVYGVTFIGAKNQVMRQLADRGDVGAEDLWHCASYLAAAIMECIGDLFQGAEQIQNWLSESAKLIAKSIPPERAEQVERAWAEEAGVAKGSGRSRGADAADSPSSGGAEADTLVPLRRTRRKPLSKEQASATRLAKEQMTSVIWTTALGLPVVQPYRKTKKKQVATAMQTVYLHDPNSNSEVSPAKQASAFPPNFIHSLDATHMILTALECQTAGLTFASVHDSYWTHACDIDTMSDLIRDTFVRLHSCDILTKLRDEFLERYKDYRVPVVAARDILKRREAQARGRPTTASLAANRAAAMAADQAGAVIVEADDDGAAAAATSDQRSGAVGGREGEGDGAGGTGRVKLVPTEEGNFARGLKGAQRDQLQRGAERGAEEDDEGGARDHEREQHDEGDEDDVEADEADLDDEGPTSADTERRASRPSPPRPTAATLSSGNARFVRLSELLPPIPKKGSFDVNEIKRSPYFFS